MTDLVLSLFPGLDALGLGFEEEGFVVVRGPDIIWGRDIRDFHPPAGVFQGICGGPPCPEHSPLRYLIAAHGYHSRHGDLISEFERVVTEAQPDWFLMEEGPFAPDAYVPGYGVHGFFLCPTWLGEEQSRKRKLSFGLRGLEPVDLRRWIDYAALRPEGETYSVLGDSRQVPVRYLKGGKPKTITVLAGRHGYAPAPGQRQKGAGKMSLQEMLRLQGLPETMLDESPLTLHGKRSLVGNAVHLGVARALARAVRAATQSERLL